jgi:hypothetical protein
MGRAASDADQAAMRRTDDDAPSYHGYAREPRPTVSAA